jgi:hypothetical protein
MNDNVSWPDLKAGRSEDVSKTFGFGLKHDVAMATDERNVHPARPDSV